MEAASIATTAQKTIFVLIYMTAFFPLIHLKPVLRADRSHNNRNGKSETPLNKRNDTQKGQILIRHNVKGMLRKCYDKSKRSRCQEFWGTRTRRAFGTTSKTAGSFPGSSPSISRRSSELMSSGETSIFLASLLFTSVRSRCVPAYSV